MKNKDKQTTFVSVLVFSLVVSSELVAKQRRMKERTYSLVQAQARKEIPHKKSAP